MNMTSCILVYKIKGESEYARHSEFLYPKKGWEDLFAEKVLNHIEAIVDGGGILTEVIRNYN